MSALIAVLMAGLVLIGLTGTVSVLLIRGEIVRLSEKTAPLQVSLAKLQRAFERVSGNFARISAAGTVDELKAVEGDTDETLQQLEAIAAELGRASESLDPSTLDAIKETHRRLRTMAGERIEARRRISATYQQVARELDSIVAVTGSLSEAMTSLQKSSQGSLVQSRIASQQSNSNIKAMLLMREKMEQMQALVKEVGLIDKKFRLNVTKDKVKALLDAVAAQPLSDPKFAAEIKSFVEKFQAPFEGEKGLLAARAAELANPQDAKAHDAFDEKTKMLDAWIQTIASRVVESVDSLELSVEQANTGMNKATELMAQVSAISAETAEVNARARSIQALAWQLLASGDTAAVDRTRGQILAQYEGVDHSLTQMRQGLGALGRKPDLASAGEAAGAFARSREMLQGAAATVRQGLEQQAMAERLFSASLESIRRTALAGSKRARDAETAQGAAVARIRALANGTILAGALIGFTVLGAGGWVGRRIRGSILTTEAREQLNTKQLLHLVGTVQEGIQSLSASSTQLSASSSHMSEGARSASEKTHSVAEAAAQMSANALSVAGSMQRASANLGLISSSTEQMTVSIGEIAGNSENARRITAEAAREAGRITEKIHRLGQTAHAIGKVSDTIKAISSQTNLLALNATIEAARAGAAGRSFAVVANEIKKLAVATAEATGDIKGRIEGVQSSTSSAVAEIERIWQVIHDVSGIVAAIATAIDQQAATARDISRNIGEASCRVGEANVRVAQTSETSQSIARDIAGVDHLAREMSCGSEQVRASATGLSRLAEQLNSTLADVKTQA